MFREIARNRPCKSLIGIGWLALAVTASMSLVSCGGSGGSGAGTEAVATQQPQTTSQATSSTTLTAAPGMSEVILSWPQVDGAVSYNLYWGTAKGVTTTSGTRITGVSAPYVHMGLTDGVDYHYIVTAVMADGSETAPWPEANTVSGSCH
ncbi:MAG: hypothetical protein HQK86_09120 [Nitrospinae bacterium]|nr:hypothetical protein [Nitrospinota bacterium]MBF0633497.1 hypothetical protein [Nitrospinota bacterium]